MFGADMVVATDDGALEEAPYVLDAVGVDVVAHPFLDAVVHGFVSRVVVGDACVGWPLVGIDGFGIVGDVFLDPGVKGLPVPSVDNLHLDLAFAFHGTNDGGFVRALSLADANLFAANPCFIHFDGAAQQLTIAVAHGLTNAMAEIPGCLVADTDRTLDLVGADALLGLDHQIDGDEPLPERELRVVEDRARGDGEAVAAVVAIELVACCDLGDGAGTATRASYAVGPAQLFQVFPASIFGAEPLNETHEIEFSGGF